jgi:putative FmdB family regulatory protein
MPVYEYICDECGKVYEVSQDLREKEPIKCYTCNKLTKRKFTVPNINWNGLRPSQGEIHPNIKHHIEEVAPNNRKEWIKK